MKKLFSGKFLIIVASSLIMLIALTVGAFYLFDKNDNTFIKSGYVLNPLSEASEKYFFEKNTGYRKNLSSMIEFSSIDDDKVEILADSFLHYDDESMSFLKNGAILDLDSIHESDAVKFYNITSSSLIQNNNGKYLIKSKNGDINIDNFIGRISDTKYIVVGDLQLKLAGNESTISGKYFEIVYVEEGIVNIENKDSKYQVMADGSFINIGNDKKIDLGNKKIIVSSKDVMSITEVTIDGNENIEIIPETSKINTEDEENKSGNGTGTGTGNETGGNDTENGNTTGGETGHNEEVKEITISLKDSSVGSTDISVIFDVTNAKDTDNFHLRVINLSSGKTVNMYSVLDNARIDVTLLTPGTKYLFSVTDDKTGNKYFQKVFETAGFGIKLEKNYASDNAISYRIIVDKDTDITDAKLSLYKYDDNGEKTLVTSDYYDANAKKTVSSPKVTYISTLSESLEGVYEVTYDGLDSDTIYTAVLDEFSLASINFKDIYNISLTSMTLKKTPKFGMANAIKNNEEGYFQLSFDEVNDPDNAITKYTYMIYKKEDNSNVIGPISKSNADPLIAKIGDGEGLLKNNTNYYYRVIIEYFDNEKYVEYVTADSITFLMEDDPYITVVPDKEKTSYDTIKGTVLLNDNSCLISIPNRTGCSDESTTYLVISKIKANVNATDEDDGVVYKEAINFTENEDGIFAYSFSVDGLKEDVSYYVDVRATLNNDEKQLERELLHSDSSVRQIDTKKLATFKLLWDTDNYKSDSDHVINTGLKFVDDTEKNAMYGKDSILSKEDSINAIKKVVLKLYKGNYTPDILNQKEMKTIEISANEMNFKDKLLDNVYQISSDKTFGFTLDDLKGPLGKDLSEYYTIAVYAYYDNEGKNEINISDNKVISYRISRILLLDNIAKPQLEVRKIKHADNSNLFKNLSDDGTIIGHEYTASFDRTGFIQNSMIPSKINFYVYNEDGSKTVDFYILENDELKRMSFKSLDLDESNQAKIEIYMDYGCEYGNESDMMCRGNKYNVGYELEILDGDEKLVYPKSGPSDIGNYAEIVEYKESPSINQMFIAKSTESSVKYSYEIVDADNSYYGNKYYYKINSSEEGTVDLTEVPDSMVKTFRGSFIIDGLDKDEEKNVTYSIYYKKNIINSSDDPLEIVDANASDDDVNRLFEGYYDASDEKYNFSYEVINNQLRDNKVKIKILATKNELYNILDRIVTYKVIFTDQKGHSYEDESLYLEKCSSDDVDNRCLTIPYTKLREKGMISGHDEENKITVDVYAYYDNGLTGYEYKVGSLEDDDYPYMIFQDNNVNRNGKYISFSRGKTITNWSNDLLITQGYYTYEFTDDGKIKYSKKNKDNTASGRMSYTLTNSGYIGEYKNINKTEYFTLNPKMISIVKMNSSKNTFSFDSIIPMVTSTNNTALLDGYVVSLTLQDATMSDFVSKDGKSNLYIKVWADEELTIKAREDVVVPFEDTNKVLTAVIDCLGEGRKYYYQVYAEMYNMNNSNKREIVQLFDSKLNYNKSNFTTSSPTKYFKNFVSNISAPGDLEYGRRVLNSEFVMNPYGNGYDYDFDLVYVFCNPSESSTCSYDLEKMDPKDIFDSDKNIFQSVVIGRKQLTEQIRNSSKVKDSIDISNCDLKYGENYIFRIYAKYKMYDVNDIEKKDDYFVLLNSGQDIYGLTELTKPSFTLYREAIDDNGTPAVKFTVNVHDTYETIYKGKYKIKFTNSLGQMVGELNYDGSKISDYSNYEFDARTINNTFTISGLDYDTAYNAILYTSACFANFCMDDELVHITTDSYTVYTLNKDLGVSVGSVLFVAHKKSVVAKFIGVDGNVQLNSLSSNVTKIGYTIHPLGQENNIIANGMYDLVHNEKKFGVDDVSSYLTFTLDSLENDLTQNQPYEVAMSIYIKDKVDPLIIEDKTEWGGD